MKNVKIIPMIEEASTIVNIEKSKSHIPKWYKESSQKIKGLEKTSLIVDNPRATTSTYKKCPPFLDAITNGYIFSLSQDIEVTLKEDGFPYILWRTDIIPPITWHSNSQWEGLVHPTNCHEVVYKWENYFAIKTPRGYSTLFTHPHNRFDLPFYTLSGIVDTDKYNLPINFPFFIKNDFTGIIKAGTPLAQITFFKRHHWFKTIKKYDKSYSKKEIFKFFSTIDRSYKKLIWQKKEYE
jgi:hypothetical protein